MDPGLEAVGGASLVELQHLHAELRLVLDHVDQGLLTLRRDGIIAGHHSAAVLRWLGPYGPGTTFWDYLGAHDPRASVLFRLGWQQIELDELPMELLLEQLPQQLRAGARTIGLSYRPMGSSGGDAGAGRMLVIVSDITDRVEREAAMVEQRELMTVFEKIVQNKTVFLEFFDEANELVRVLTAVEERPPIEVVRRLTHTLKGNCALFGLITVQELCHRIETEMLERDGDMSPEEREALRERWRKIARLLGSLFGRSEANRVEIDAAEYGALQRAVEKGAPYPQLALMIAAWSLQPVQGKFDYLAAYARDLAQRMGKGPLQVRVEANRLRVCADRWGGFFASLVHVVSNAVDHGIETQDERRRGGKPEVATLLLRAYLQGETFYVEVSDDGRGVQWDRLAERARSEGMPAETRAQLIEALFNRGISSRSEVSQYSGRGVGMSAVWAACQALGGQIKLASQPARGTTIQFRFAVARGDGPEDRADVLSPMLAP